MFSKRSDRGLSRREWLWLTGATAAGGMAVGCTPSADELADAPQGVAPGPRTLADKPNIVVFLTDSMRARELGIHGCEWPTSPVLDDFARQSFHYTHCLSPSSWTKPSIGSIFTGLTPTTHQTIHNAFGVPAAERTVHELPSRFVTMAESLRMVGYHTYWSLEHPIVQARLGYGQGFEEYHYRWPPEPASQVERLDQALRQPLPEPFFLFVHMIDPHVPYMPPETLLHELFGAGSRDILATTSPDQAALIQEFHEHLVRLRQNPALDAHEPRPQIEERLTPDGAAAWRHFYAASVRHVDALFGRFLDTLDETGLAGRTYVAFTSDHGEAFREHGSLMHGHTLYEEEIHVPLMMRPPGGTDAAPITDPVSLLDLYPSFATLGGAPMPPYLHGAPLLDGNGAPLDQSGRLVLSETNRFIDDPAYWHLTGHRGSMKVYRHDAGARVEAYDLAGDPLEATDLAADDPPASVGDLQEALAKAHGEHQRMAAAFGPPAQLQFEQDEDSLTNWEDLDAVGYI